MVFDSNSIPEPVTYTLTRAPFVTEAELSTLAGNHDIISLGVLADDLRRQRHGTKTTFVRVRDFVADVGEAGRWSACGGRVADCRASRRAAPRRRTRQGSRGRRRGGSRLGIFARRPRTVAARESVTLRALLEELRARGSSSSRKRRRSAPERAPLDSKRSHRRPLAGAADGASGAIRRPDAAAQGRRRPAAGGRRRARLRAAAAPRQSAAPTTATTTSNTSRWRASSSTRGVNPGGLVAVRSEAGASRPHRRRRRCGRRVGGGGDDRGAPPRAARRDSPQHPRGRAGAIERNGRFDVMSRDERSR